MLGISSSCYGWGLADRKAEVRMRKKNFIGKPKWKRSIQRSRSRWESNVQINLIK
jgi:hypothetical protein